jgi:hypothetical protein
MKTSIIAMLFILAGSLAALAAKRPEFSGIWTFNPDQSQNIGMMSQMKMTQTIEQSPTALDVTSDTTFRGSDQEMKTHYDLTGKPATNDSPMEGTSETVSKWNGEKIVTTWTSQGAVENTKTVRTETRSLSPDGKRMRVESVRGPNPAVVIVFDKK